MQRKTLVAVTAIALTSLLSADSMADATPEDAKDYRSAIMTALRGHIGAASMIARGLIDNDGQLVSHAQGLNNGAMELGKLFPEGSNVGESEALPAIWENPDDFAEAIANMQSATAAFVEAAESGDGEAIGAAFRNVGMGCRGCHDNFRQQND